MKPLVLKALGLYKHDSLQSKLQSKKIPNHGAPLRHSLMTTEHISADGERFIATTKSFLLPPTNNEMATSQCWNLPCLYLRASSSA